MTTMDDRIRSLEQRVANLEALLKKPPSVYELWRRRQAKLEQYRQDYERQQPEVDIVVDTESGEDEIDCA